MSSSYIVEPEENSSKKDDDTLIIVLNDEGTIAVDHATLQNLIMNQSNANVSVVRVGQAGDDENGDLTFTVDPPAFVPTETTPSSTTVPGASDPVLVDPFMEMDPEQLEKLETALQSEQAKQILGENVAAMLDMLTVEEEQNTIKYAIELDHCYTSRSSPADPAPMDPLPVAHSPDVETAGTAIASVQPHSQGTSEESREGITSPAKAVTKPKLSVGRPRKSAVSSVQSLSNPKSPATALPRNTNAVLPQKTGSKDEDTNTYEFSSSSESSESAASDNDSDFGPRGPRRPGVRARGGRRGLTTRGGSMAGGRRRGSGKRMDVDQARRLDIEMAAAVTAMKSTDHVEKSDKVTPQMKKQLKTIPSRKKEELPPVVPISNEVAVDKSLHTTNQVKANLINANMIKGDMILTKPGQGRNNQRVFFVQKKVVMKANELKNFGVKQNPVIVSKDAVKVTNQIQTKLITSDEGKLVTTAPKTTEVISSPILQPEIPLSPVQLSPPAQFTKQGQLIPKKLPKVIPIVTKPADNSALKTKPSPEIKKDARKSDSTSESLVKLEDSPKASVDVKTPDSAKKHQKKDQRKPPVQLVDALGPALFSTPDIIRRVSLSGDTKCSEANASFSSNETSMTETPTNSSLVSMIKTDYSSLGPEMQPSTANLLGEPSSEMEYSVDDQTSSILNDKQTEEDSRLPDADDIHSPLDPTSNSTANGEIARPSEDSVHNIISGQTGIEGEEHLLATLEMEASKHEEELLAEALLLQEHLDVDLTDPTALDGTTSSLPESLLSPSAFDTSMLSETNDELSPDKLIESPIHDSSAQTPFADQQKKKDNKEPIQIVRGGRVITLPPIEAPATRSKRLATKSESSPRVQEISKKEEKLDKNIVHDMKPPDEMDSEMEDEEDNSDSEDDPDRLWCICKRPHNNRFMICCDVCEDWFHGKCVHVSKAMGQQMEEQGIEWVCPNCEKKKNEGSGIKVSKPSIKALTTAESPSQNVSGPMAPEPTEKLLQIAHDVKQNVVTLPTVVTQCVVCKKEARNSSIYCSDACILMHARETLTKDKPPTPTTQAKFVKTSTGDLVKPSPEARVIVFERRTGKVLTGPEAPTTSNLKTWLKEHPTFEVVRPKNLNTLQIGGKTVQTIQAQAAGKIGKAQPSTSGQPKMVFAKIVGSKQTVLASSAKKSSALSSTLQSVNILSKSPGQKLFITTSKGPVGLKQTTLKLVTQAPGKSPTAVIKQTINKKQDQTRATTSAVKPPQKSPVLTARKSEPEPIRMNIRKTLAELLTTRIKDAEDLKLTDDQISDLALNIELELYKYFRDTGSKYKAKYRSLVFNIKDTKNLTLFRKIADKSLTPHALVRLSPDEMASQELAEWREKETKHQLEMIKKNELDLMAQAKSILVKTHKGEQIIENDGGSTEVVDPKTSVQDIVTVLNNADNTSSDILDDKDETTSLSLEDSKKSKRNDDKKKKDKDRERDKDGHRSRNRDRGKESKRDRSASSRSKRHRSRDRRRSKEGKREKDRDRERDREKDKDRDKNKDKHKEKKSRRSKSSSIRGKSNHKEHKDSDKKRTATDDESKRESEKKKEPSPVLAEKPIEDRLWRHIEDETTTHTLDGNDSDVSDREPSSTVNIKTPDINEEPEREKEATTEPEVINNTTETVKGSFQTVWRGFVNMIDVAKFFITAQELSGHAKDLMEDLPDTVDVVGRISHETVWEYISKMKKTGSKEIIMIRLTAANDEEQIPYITLYSYLDSRSRLGVVGNVSKNIKDFYIMPFSKTSQIPPVLMPFVGPGFEDQRPHLLLGIIVRNKRKRQAHPLPIPAVPPKVIRKESDRSFTPPPAVYIPKDKHSNSTEKSIQLLDIHSDQSSVTQKTLSSLNKAHVGMSRGLVDSAVISKIVPELSSKIDLTSSSPDKLPQDDGDEPYSPGDLEDDDDNSMANLTAPGNIMSPAKNSTELQRKMDELNRQIEEQKQQIQSISSSFLGESVPTLPGLGLDPPGITDGDEAYSPSDVGSFTPPPPGLAQFTQPILDKVSNITIPANLQEILANVKRQENSKVDPYLPSKPSASFLTSVNAPGYQKTVEKTYTPTATVKESKSTLRSLSDMDLIKKAEEELAAVAASMAPAQTLQMPDVIPPDLVDAGFSTSLGDSSDMTYQPTANVLMESLQTSRVSEQPKPPGLENEDLPSFPSTPPTSELAARSARSPKFPPKSGVVLNVKRKANDEIDSTSPTKTPRVKSRWGQGPSD